MKNELIDEIINERIMFGNLQGQTCALKHSKKDPSENHQAVNYLSQKMTNSDTIAIPICQECVEALHSNTWVLLYCVNCNQSQWVHKGYAKRHYKDNEHVIFMTACPHCYKEEKHTLH